MRVTFQGFSMKQYLTFQGAPMVLVIGLVLWAWISILSVLVGSFF
jgi:hypothetical protein